MHHIILMSRQPLSDRVHRDLSGLLFGVTIYSRRNIGEYNAVKPVLPGKFQRLGIAGGQKDRILLVAVVDRADCMDDVPGRQIIAARDLSLSGMASVQGSAFRKQPRSCSSVDRSVNASSSQQGCVGRIDDTVRLHFRDITLCDQNSALSGPFRRLFRLQDLFDDLSVQKQRILLRIEDDPADLVGRPVRCRRLRRVLLQRFADRRSHCRILSRLTALIGFFACISDLPCASVPGRNELHPEGSGRCLRAALRLKGLYRKQDMSAVMHRSAKRFKALHKVLSGPVLCKRRETLFQLFTAGKGQLDGFSFLRRGKGIFPGLHPRGILLPCDPVFLQLLVKALEDSQKIVRQPLSRFLFEVLRHPVERLRHAARYTGQRIRVTAERYRKADHVLKAVSLQKRNDRLRHSLLTGLHMMIGGADLITCSGQVISKRL